MADRFSRFNEDRDFQVNTGVAEDPGEAPAELEPSPLLLAPSPSRFCSGSGSLFSASDSSGGASQLESRPHLTPSSVASSAQVAVFAALAYLGSGSAA